MQRLLLATLLSALLPACGDSACETNDDQLALPNMCLRATPLVRRQGAWTEVGTRIEATEVDGGYVVELVGDGDAEGLALSLPGVDADLLMQQGYQSWGFSGTVTVPAQITIDDDDMPTMAAARSGDPIDEEHGVSSHAILLRRGSDGPVLVIGALRAEVATTAISAVRAGDDADVTVLYGPQREQLPAGRSEPIYIGTADTPEQALAQLGAALAAEHVDSRPLNEPPGGWFSWNERFANIDEDYIADHVAEISTSLATAGMPLVEIDDGWERAWGDWQANESFPAGMEATATTINDAGLVAGVWLAPFLVDVTSDAAQSDPSLFVQGPDNQPLVHQLSGNQRRFYVLDGTNPDAMAIVTDEIANLADAGYQFFKLDFLYAGALTGGRSQDVTGVQAMRAGLERIRQVVGDDAIINACGAPTLQMLGLADSLRIGPDTAFEGFDLSWSLVAAAARNLAARRYLFPTIYLDADQVQLRSPYTADEAAAGAAVAALAGPAYAVGDDLTTLNADRLALALDDTVLDIAGASLPASPVGLMEMLPGDEIAASPVYEAFRYPSGMAVAPPPRFEVTGASGTAYRVQIDWDRHTVTIE